MKGSTCDHGGAPWGGEVLCHDIRNSQTGEIRTDSSVVFGLLRAEASLTMQGQGEMRGGCYDILQGNMSVWMRSTSESLKLPLLRCEIPKAE